MSSDVSTYTHQASNPLHSGGSSRKGIEAEWDEIPELCAVVGTGSVHR